MSALGLDALFAPRQVTVLGRPGSAAQRQILDHLAVSLESAQRVLVGKSAKGWRTQPSLGRLEHVDLAVVFDGRLLDSDSITQLHGLGCRAVIVATDFPVRSATRDTAVAAGIRVLGARSAGVMRAAADFNACAFTEPAGTGRIALISQSRTIAAAAIDWARGRKLGLAWFANTGAESDIDVADLLDYAAMDPDVDGIVVQLGRVRDGRRFMSAARAAARAKPVAVLQTHDGREVLFPALGADPVRSAAFARAGLVECDSLGGLFDAIALLGTRRQEIARSVAVIGNGAGVCALGVDALLRAGVRPAMLSDACRRQLQQRWPLSRISAGAVDLGTLPAGEIVAVAEQLLTEHGIGMVLLMHSPEPGHPHAGVARAFAQSNHSAHIASVWLGLDTALEARRICAENGMKTFVAPEDAARALRYPRQHWRTREALMQTPPLWRGFRPRRERAEAALARLGADDSEPSSRHAALQLLEAYGVGRHRGRASGPGIHLRLFRHPEFGSCLAVRADAPAMRGPEVYVLPPLDALLARRALQDVGFRWEGSPPRTHRDLQRLAIALIRFAGLIIEQPSIAVFNVRLAITRRGGHCHLVDAQLQRQNEALEERQRLVLAPYPASLSRQVELGKGLRCRMRAIRPEDEPALIEMLEHTDREAIRLRFFHVIRYFTHAMAARFSQIDYDRELVLVATLHDADPDAMAIIASGHLSIDDGGKRAEYAILVHQSHARHGLGGYLLKRLIDYARMRGVEVVYGEVLAENKAMLGLARRLGFAVRFNPGDPGCMITEIDLSLLPPTAGAARKEG